MQKGIACFWRIEPPNYEFKVFKHKVHHVDGEVNVEVLSNHVREKYRVILIQ